MLPGVAFSAVLCLNGKNYMPCYVMYDEILNSVGHMCGKLGKHCAECRMEGVS